MASKTPQDRVVDASSTDPRAQRTRSAILAATTRLFSSGDDDFSVQQVATEAGVSRASFYTHFSGIDEVLRIVLSESFADIRDGYEAELLSGTVSRLQAMHNANAMLADGVWKHRDLLAGMLRGPSGADVFDVISTGIAREMNISFTRGIAPIPDGISGPLAATYVAGAGTAMLTAWVSGRIDATRDEIAHHLTALMPHWLAVADASGN